MVDITITKDIMSLQGELTRHTLSQISNKTLKPFIAQSTALVDLQHVSKVDTAGLAWLFYLLEQAQQADCLLRFANLPTKLDNLINLSGVEGFLPK